MPFRDKTLDEYCYEFLEESELKRRDEDQVFSRYSRRKVQEKQSRLETGGDQANGKDTSQQIRNTTFGNVDKMVVVSQLWIWLLGGLVHYSHPAAGQYALPRLTLNRCCCHKLQRWLGGSLEGRNPGSLLSYKAGRSENTNTSDPTTRPGRVCQERAVHAWCGNKAFGRSRCFCQ